MRSIEVIVEKDGTYKIRYDGFKGKACFQEAKRLYEVLKSLGLDVKIEETVPTVNVGEVTYERES